MKIFIIQQDKLVYRTLIRQNKEANPSGSPPCLCCDLTSVLDQSVAAQEDEQDITDGYADETED